MYAPYLLPLLLPFTVVGSGEHDHPFEWSGAYSLEAEDFTFNFARGSNGEYAAASMKVVMLQTSTADEAGIEEQESLAETLLEGSAMVQLQNLGLIMPSTTSAYNISMDAQSFLTLVKVNSPAEANYVFYMEHNPNEFRGSDFWFKHLDGDDVPAAATIPREEGESSGSGKTKNEIYGLAIAATFITCLPTLVVIVFVWSNVCSTHSILFLITSAFAYIRVLAAAVFLHIYPEVFEFLADVPGDEMGWKSGSVVMTGILTGLILDILPRMFLPESAHQHSGKPASVNSVGGYLSPNKRVPEGKRGIELENPSTARLKSSASMKTFRIIYIFLIGDFFHNFVDGLLIGTAFKSCSVSKGWAIAMLTIAHELPQEIGDFFILVNAGMSKCTALLTNFAVSLAAILGAIVIVENDISEKDQGYLLAYTCGIFLYASLCGVLPDLIKSSEGSRAKTLALFGAFAFGAFVIGLSVIRHEHCHTGGSQGDEGGAHAGHNH
ncbi:hypothetical protein AAMO2058_000628900 [Amorphochlora amoebiformis]